MLRCPPPQLETQSKDKQVGIEMPENRPRCPLPLMILTFRELLLLWELNILLRYLLVRLLPPPSLLLHHLLEMDCTCLLMLLPQPTLQDCSMNNLSFGAAEKSKRKTYW